LLLRHYSTLRSPYESSVTGRRHTARGEASITGQLNGQPDGQPDGQLDVDETDRNQVAP